MIGKRIKEKRIFLGKTQEWLAEKSNTTRQTIHRYENGEISNIPSDRIEMIAKALETTPSFLMGWNNEGLVNPLFDKAGYVRLRVIPIGASCGGGINNNDYASSTELFPTELINGKDTDDYFISYAKGVSMERVGIHDNDLLLFKEQPVLNNGEIGLFTLNGEEFIKRFKKMDNSIMLISESFESYDPIIVSDDDDLIIRAKLSKVIKSFD